MFGPSQHRDLYVLRAACISWACFINHRHSKHRAWYLVLDALFQLQLRSWEVRGRLVYSVAADLVALHACKFLHSDAKTQIVLVFLAGSTEHDSGRPTA